MLSQCGNPQHKCVLSTVDYLSEMNVLTGRALVCCRGVLFFRFLGRFVRGDAMIMKQTAHHTLLALSLKNGKSAERIRLFASPPKMCITITRKRLDTVLNQIHRIHEALRTDRQTDRQG